MANKFYLIQSTTKNLFLLRVLPAIDLAKLPAIQVRSLSFYYGEQQALQDVLVDIEPREITAIIGSSGCGKSTFIKALDPIGELESKIRV